MSLNTFPCNPYPISTEELNKGNNDDLNTRVSALETAVEEIDNDKADLGVIAAEFDAETGTYEIGDLVTNEGKLYEFTSDHSTPGAWDPTEVTEKTVADEVNFVKSCLTNYENQNNTNLEVPNRKNLFDKDDADNLTGRALNSETGEPYVASGWMTSNFIKIDPSTTYTLTTTSVSSSVAFYDSAKAYISGAPSFGTKTTPSNAKYLRFDYKTENADIMQLELGSTATAYAPYIPSVESRLDALVSDLSSKVVPSESTSDVKVVQVGNVVFVSCRTTCNTGASFITNLPLCAAAAVSVGNRAYISYNTAALRANESLTDALISIWFIAQ